MEKNQNSFTSGLSATSLSVLKTKYLRKNEKGEISETPEECFSRVAKFVAQAEEEAEKRKISAEKFLEIMEKLEFLPGGRTLANAGTNFPQLANCFVLPMEDNIEEIFEVVRDSSILKKFGGGVGFSFSRIRPKHDSISGTSGSACGPVALMKVIDAASDIFMQDGKRRSGNMVVLSVAHPDVLDFVTAKKDQTRLPQVNFSLGVSDRFMKAVEGNKRWDLINPRSGKVVMTIKARSIFEVATAMAWEGGDPGLIFLDRINRDNPTPNLGPIEAVNLCGEQPLLPYEACNLGSINLVKFLKEPTDGALRSAQEFCAVQKVRSWQNFVPPRASLKTGILKMVDQRLSLDWDHLAEVIEIAVRFLDDVISVCRYPLPKVDRMVKLNRKIGLGVMGWADALVKMGIPFDSKEATDLAGELMKFISKTAHRASMALGKEKGSFPSFSGSIWEKKSRWMRNATCTSIAPTGSISMVAGVSAGIEPLFALSYYKEVWGGVRLPEINQDLISELEKLDLDNLGEVKKQIIKNGTLEGVKAVPEKLHRVFVTAHEIDPAWHVKMQAAFQKYTDNAVSKTINLPNQATVEDVEKAFVLSWKLGCKGITVYRDKSRKEQVLHLGTEDVEINNKSICPTCKTSLVREEGCLSCPKCGFSACEL